MNIEKLEKIFHEMEAARLESDADRALVRSWAARIHDAISEHLLEQIGAASVQAPGLSGAPGGHDWDED